MSYREALDEPPAMPLKAITSGNEEKKTEDAADRIEIEKAQRVRLEF